jgi:hypothetical protein
MADGRRVKGLQLERMWRLSKHGMFVMGAPIVLACIFTIATGLDVGVKVLRGGEVAAATCLDRLSGS